MVEAVSPLQVANAKRLRGTQFKPSTTKTHKENQEKGKSDRLDQRDGGRDGRVRR